MRRLIPILLLCAIPAFAGEWNEGSEPRIKELEAKLRAGKAEAADYARLGTTLAVRGDHEKALQYYKEAARLEPTATPYLNNVAITYYSLEMMDEAAQWFEKTLQVNPDEPLARQYLDSIRKSNAQHESSMKKVEADLQPAEKTFEAYRRSGKALLQFKRWEAAENIYLEAETMEPHSYEVKAALALLAYRRRDFATSLRRWEEAAAIQPQELEAQVQVGRLYAALARYPEAARAWTRVAQMTRPGQPEHQEAQYYLTHLSSFLQ